MSLYISKPICESISECLYIYYDLDLVLEGHQNLGNILYYIITPFDLIFCKPRDS
jgi:hypothetical protein